MNIYTLDTHSLEWMPLNNTSNFNYFLESEQITIQLQNVTPKFIKDTPFQTFLFSNNDNYIREKLKKVFLFLYSTENLNKNFLISSLGFQNTVNSNVLRYHCQNFPFVLDCIYDENETLVTAVIVSYTESACYSFNPKNMPVLLPLFVFDDLSGIDFFCDIDVSLHDRKLLQIIDKEVSKLLKANKDQVSTICSLKDSTSMIFSDIVKVFDQKTVTNFNASMRRINTSYFVKNNFSLIFVWLSFLILIVVIIFKFELILLLQIFIKTLS
jgi:hypothetical protein